MKSHTPGPWTVGEVAPDRRDFDACVRADGWEVAYLKAFNVEQAQANARLIAAAPDLLAACRDQLANLSRRSLTRQKWTTGDQQAFEKLETAIAKAVS